MRHGSLFDGLSLVHLHCLEGRVLNSACHMVQLLEVRLLCDLRVAVNSLRWCHGYLLLAGLEGATFILGSLLCGVGLSLWDKLLELILVER